ncbi:MAG: nucleotide exchange factor GrpE [Candidatus Borkfalkiaceae bacterium]|nr:nucleotide exchange factor GrpE [Christensenellaceae bacterium]
MSEEKKEKETAAAEEELPEVEEKTEETQEGQPESETDVDGLTEEEAKEKLRGYIADNAALEEALLKMQAKAEEAHNDYLRARADCENVRKRKAEEIRTAYDDGRTEVIAKILPIGDSLDWALKIPLDDKTKEGIEKLLKKYHETLEALGVKEFSPEEGSDFDPNTAAAVMQVDGEKEESGKIRQVFGRGYKLGEKVIRYAQVSVVR